MLSIDFKDTGIGIPLDEQERIFAPFEQEGCYSRSEGSSGLGLAICSSYASMMNGELTVASQEGKGALFRFTVMLEAFADEEEEEATLNGTEATEDTEPHTDSEDDIPQVLVLDMEENAKLRVREALQPFDVSIKVAKNRKEALATLSRCRPELILFDLNVASARGIELVSRIRNEFAEKDQPTIVLMSSQAFRNDVDRYLRAGCDAFIPKGLIKAQLLEIIQVHRPGMLESQSEDLSTVQSPMTDSHSDPEYTDEFSIISVPDDLREQLVSASVNCDYILLLQLCQDMEENGVLSPMNAGKLRQIVEDFRFDQIQELCKNP